MTNNELIQDAIKYSIKDGKHTTEFIVLVVGQLSIIAVSTGLVTSDIAQEALPYITLMLLGMVYTIKEYIAWRSKLKLDVENNNRSVSDV